jgi:hypothetical protein
VAATDRPLTLASTLADSVGRRVVEPDPVAPSRRPGFAFDHAARGADRLQGRRVLRKQRPVCRDLCLNLPGPDRDASACECIRALGWRQPLQNLAGLPGAVKRCRPCSSASACSSVSRRTSSTRAISSAVRESWSPVSYIGLISCPSSSLCVRLSVRLLRRTRIAFFAKVAMGAVRSSRDNGRARPD